jgi:hypothetical protein
VLTEEDAASGATFEDVVAWRSGPMDIGYTRYEKMKTHDVPYRALIPMDTGGILSAGRCISATHVGASSGKSMGNCIATGQAAGVAAALAVKQRRLPGDLDVSRVQSELKEQGVDLERGGKEQSEDAFDTI